MVGRAVVRQLQGLAGLDVRHANRSGSGGALVIDALTSPPLDELLNGVDLVVNAIGILRAHPDYPRDRYRVEATKVNAIFPLLLAEAAGRRDCRVVHISSDAVFGPAEDPADESTP